MEESGSFGFNVYPSAAGAKTVTSTAGWVVLGLPAQGTADSNLDAMLSVLRSFIRISSLSLCQYRHPQQLDRQPPGRERLCLLHRTVHWAWRWGTWVQASVLPLTGSLGLAVLVHKVRESDQRSLFPLPHREVMLSHFIFPWKGDLRLKIYFEKRLCHLLQLLPWPL